MVDTMDAKMRVELIRKGNELFNKGDIELAAKIFAQTGYRDGLTRVADHFFYDKRQPLFALKFYKMVNRQDKVQEIYERMIFALGRLMGKNKEQKVELPPVKVSPKLKILAEEILRNEKNEADRQS
jgi:hypothetical protein